MQKNFKGDFDSLKEYVFKPPENIESIDTKVLLVCIKNKNGILLTHKFYYKLFSTYGKVNKVRRI